MKKRIIGLCVALLCLSLTGLAYAQSPKLNHKEMLGKLVFEDTAFSANGNQSCQTCHHPDAAFSDPVNRISPMYRPVSEGSDGVSFGDRNAPPAAYTKFSPPLFWDDAEGLFIGGLFWDGRASGIAVTDTGGLGAGATLDPLADQAKGPFGSAVEMALVDESGTGGLTTEEKVVNIVALKYAKQYRKAWKSSIANDDVGVAYNNIALAISAFEKSKELNKFNTKFDKFRKEQRRKGLDVSQITVDFLSLNTIKSRFYTQDEIEGLALFNTEPVRLSGVVQVGEGGGGCFLCHPVPANNATKAESVFTDFSYDNLGIPNNPAVDTLAGTDPLDQDLGLGGQEAVLVEAYNNAMGTTLTALDPPLPTLLPEQNGKFKVSSLRNIALTAPYGHNGFFPTLYDIVHFYNVRGNDPDPATWNNIWGLPEVAATVNTEELGDLGLTFEGEQKIVLFLETLTDN